MKNQLIRNRKWLILFFAVFGCFSVDAQSVDSIQHNGEQYYVYPFRKEVKIHDDYWKIVEDEAFFADYNNYFNLFKGDFLFSREKFQKAKTQKRKDYLEKKLEERWKNMKRGRKFGKAATKTLRNRPGELIEVSYDHDKDVLPPFGAIPDGKYVQLFKDFCLVDENGMCQSDTYQIAGYFTIKNNVIDGKAVWLDFKGDTLKQGNFINGLKDGEWNIKYPDDLSYYTSRLDRKKLRKGGSIFHWYQFETSAFKNGLNHGPYKFWGYNGSQNVTGEFEFGEASGEWNYFTEGHLTVKVQIANPNDTVVSRKPILRGMSMENPRRYFRSTDGKDRVEYDLKCRNAPMPNFPHGFYEIQYEAFEEELELEGETDKSFDLTDARRYDQYGNNGSRYDINGTDEIEYHPETRVAYPRWVILDSLGAKMKYNGVYEQYYMNGQLFFRYEFKNGHLISEDTLFWDNGNPLDIIIFQADSNKYYRSLYARDGYCYDVMIYDSLGAFIEYYDDSPEVNLEVTIDGFAAMRTNFETRNNFNVRPVDFYYVDPDTVSIKNRTENVVLSRTWVLRDSSIQTNTEYNPLTREYIDEKYNFFGKVHAKTAITFTEDFSGWTGKKYSNYGNLSLERSMSGVKWESDVSDTISRLSIGEIWREYETTGDSYLYNNDELYTGDFRYKSSFRMFKVKAKSKKIKVSFSRPYYGFNQYYRARKKKKTRKRLLLESLTNEIELNQASNKLQRDFKTYFRNLLYDYNEYLSYSVDYSKFEMKSVEGQFLDGKAHGIWTTFDKKGKAITTVNFYKGELDGELRLYNYQDKRPKRRNYNWGGWYDDNSNSVDTFPKRRVRYLQYVVNFKNGQREGTSTEFDWLGREVITGEFKNDRLEGKMIVREPETHTEATFKDGYLDGYLKTYLTFPKRDSILLYDINLQNGLLNGESKSYHTNGRLAKRGFFLDGEPIEDYESYDTLGFKYHYVKFQYGVPIEEKIWEENALSIRYQFDWKDSIEFYPDDITSTQSLEALLAREGYINYSSEDKYYGRTSLISKEEIECQMTKFYPNDTIARDGKLKNKQKIGLWKFYSYNGDFLYEANYFDSVIVINDSIKFRSKGILTDYDDDGNRLFSAYIIEKFEKYDCAHTDHYEVRQLLTIDEENERTGRMNGFVRNFYDNGTLQAEGTMKNGIPEGLWKFYDPFGKLNKMGNYKFGKRNGRWLEGDLAKKKYLGEICMNPNLEDLEERQKYQENLLDITIINYMMGKQMSTQFYDVDMNRVLEIEENRN